jgi:hypothetical protein
MFALVTASQMASASSIASADGEPVDLRRHDEIVFVQPLDLLRPQRNRRIAPPERDVRVMTLLLGEAADPVDEAQRCREVRELEGPRDPRRVVDEILVRRLTMQGFGFLARQRRNSAAARGAPFGKRSFHDAISSGDAPSCRRVPPRFLAGEISVEDFPAAHGRAEGGSPGNPISRKSTRCSSSMSLPHAALLRGAQ